MRWLLGLPTIRCLLREHIGTSKMEKHESGFGYAVFAPVRHRRWLYAAEPRYLNGSAKGVYDLGVRMFGVHCRMLAIATYTCQAIANILKVRIS